MSIVKLAYFSEETYKGYAPHAATAGAAIGAGAGATMGYFGNKGIQLAKLNPDFAKGMEYAAEHSPFFKRTFKKVHTKGKMGALLRGALIAGGAGAGAGAVAATPIGHLIRTKRKEK